MRIGFGILITTLVLQNQWLDLNIMYFIGGFLFALGIGFFVAETFKSVK